MNIFLRDYKEDFNLKAIINVLDNGSFDIKFFEQVKDLNLTEAVYEDLPFLSKVVTREEMLFDAISKKPIAEDHSVIVFAETPGAYVAENEHVCINLFKHTSLNKASIRGIKNVYQGINALLIIFVPFADSPVEDWTIVASVKELTFNGNAITQKLNVDKGKAIGETADEILPGIVLTNNNGDISAQLINSDNSLIAKAGVEIYFETTAGYLTKGRATTDSNGVATTKVVGAEEGKVKAGFKHFTGKTEVTI
jgi:hypothetical protein